MATPGHHGSVRTGLYFDLRNPAAWHRPWPDLYARVLELVEESERLGAGSVWFSEHHFFDDGYLPQPLTFAAAAASRTGRIRIGTAVVLAPLRHAVHVAEEAAVVDILSGGRLELGLGAGYRVPEFEAFGADLQRRFGATDDTVRTLRELWAEGRVGPPPVQNPMPIWLGYAGPQGARRAGRLGDGLLSLRRDLLEPYTEGLREGGHADGTARMGGVLNIVVVDDPEAAWPAVKPHLAYRWDSYRRSAVEGTDLDVPRPVDPDRWRRPGPRGEPPRLEVLTVEQAAAAVRERIDGLPVTDVFLWAGAPGMPDHLLERHVQLVSGELSAALAS